MTQSPVLHNLGDVLRLPRHRERIALTDLREAARIQELSALEFDALCAAVARGLLRRGIGRGARIGILAENRLEFMAAYFGIMRMGAVAVPVNHRLPRATIAHIFRDSAIELVFSDSDRRALLPPGPAVIDFDDPAHGFPALLDPGSVDTFLPGEQDLAEILYTSGSTGVPKGVPLNHHGQLWAMGRYLEPLPAEAPQDTTIVVAPLYHMNGLFNICMALAQRTRVILLPRFDARRFLEVAAEYRCTRLSGIPTHVSFMVPRPRGGGEPRLGGGAKIPIGSAPLTDALLAQVHRLFPNA